MHQSEPSDLRIYSLTRLTEGRDPETLGHVERVCAYSGILARKLATHRRFRSTLNADFIGRLTLAAALHDAGKAAIPSEILLKPAPLNEWESTIVRQHTTLGADAVRDLLQRHPDSLFREMAVEIALTHHERWDGTGYPNNLREEEIPVAGRIVAVADVYDALTSKRVYKDAFSHDLARSVILRDRGSHFDPAIVDAFLASEHMMLDAAAEHADRMRRAA